MSDNVLGIRRFFVPDEEKCVAFLRAQKNVAEQNPTKGVPALSARPTGGLCSPNCPNRAICVYRLLGDVNFAFTNYFLAFQKPNTPLFQCHCKSHNKANWNSRICHLVEIPNKK